MMAALNTATVVAVIGLNLAGIPIKNMAPTAFDAWMQAVTFLSVGLVAVYTRGMTQRLLILVGLLLALVRRIIAELPEWLSRRGVAALGPLGPGGGTPREEEVFLRLLDEYRIPFTVLRPGDLAKADLDQALRA